MMTKQHGGGPRMLDRFERLTLHTVPRHAAWLVALTLVHGCGDVVGPAATRASHVSRSTAESPATNITAGTLQTFYGPEQFTRGRGAPETFTRQISTAAFEAPFVLHVRSGDAAGANRVSSATVRLDGTTLLGPSAFNQQQSEWSLPVALGGSATLQVNLQGKPGSYLDIWIEGTRSGTLFCSDGTSDASDALRQAIDATPAGGTVLVCQGTHRVAEVRIAKPLTIQGIGPTKPVLDFGGQCCGLRVDGAVGGTIRIRGLRFQHGSYQEILLAGPTDSVVVEGSDFYIGSQTGNPWGGYTGVAAGNGASVLIQDNTFNDGDVGVNVGQGSSVTILNNSFSNQDVAIHDGDISTVHVEHNAFSDCRVCIGVFDVGHGGTMEILQNTIQADFARPTTNAFQLAVGTYRIERNVITGSGGARDPNDPSTWPIQSNAIAFGGTASLSGNRISGAWNGLAIGGEAVRLAGSDNTISDVGSVLFVFQAIAVTLNRNDFTSYGNPIRYVFEPGFVSLTCNWWGSAAGPQNVSQWATFYSPWATQPIANQPGVTCAP